MGSIGETENLSMDMAYGKVKGFWCKILDLEDEDLEHDSNFFALGGDSIDALKVARLAQEAGIALDVHIMIRHPLFSQMVKVALKQPSLKSVQIEDSQGTMKSSKLLEIPLDRHYEVISQAIEQCQISEADIETIFPCTPMQIGLMVQTARQPDLYWAQQTFQLPDDWSFERTVSAWRLVVEANEALRSRIIQLSNGNCYQVVLDSKFVSKSDDVSVNGFTSPFGQPLFFCWIKPGRFQWLVHHAVYDAWSQRLILDALTNAYKDLNSQTISYAPFSSFASQLAKEDNTQSLNFWKQYLHGYEGQSFPRPLSTNEARGQAHVSMSSSWGPNQYGLGFTAATAIQTAWGIILTRYNESPDVVFGLVSTGRTKPVKGQDISRIIGPTIATVPFRLKLEDATSVQTALVNTRADYGEFLPHEHVGLEHIASLGDSGPAQAAQFKSLLVIQPEEPEDNVITELMINRRDDYMDFPLSLECFLGSGSIYHKLTYTESSMGKWEAERLLERFIYVLDWVLQPFNQETPVSELQLWTPFDSKVMKEWHSNPTPLVEECVHSLIEDRSAVGGWEDSFAICAWDGELTYRQLLVASKQLAYRLRDAGARPETVIPILHQKSCWTTISILAVLQSGSAFVLLDSGLPRGRMQTMISIVKAPFAICSEALKSKIVDLIDQVLCLDTSMQKELMLDPPMNVDRRDSVSSGVGAFNAAYVVFTSGTTGIPKAVVAEHRHVATAFDAQAAKGMFQQDRRMLQVATYSFDPSIADMLGPLLVGGTVCIPREEEVLTDLAGAICRFKVDVIDITPSLANLLDPSEVPLLTELRLGGEPVTRMQLNRWTDRGRSRPNLQFHNSYGPSECCVTAALTPPLHPSVDPLNFGFPVGCRMVIVNPKNTRQLVPLGLVGELVIQGPIVTRGYLNDPDAQRKAFAETAPYENVPTENNPPWAERVYFTGDLAKFAPDGSVVFVGRKDQQVKLHGQRLELGEIEATATKIEGVDEAVAMIIKHDGRAELVLVAQRYIPGHPQYAKDQIHNGHEQNDIQTLNLPDIHASIFKRIESLLPVYMVPAICLLVDRIPLSLTGKTDRKWLRTWVEQRHDLSRWRKTTPTEIISPSDTMARDLSRILVPLLPPMPDWDSENPADLAPVLAGLDSIRMISFVRTINRTYDIDLPLTRIHRTTSTTQLARIVENLQSRVDSAPDDEKDSEDIESMLKDLANGIPSHVSPNLSRSSAIHRVFLTGATGYVGTSILQSLLAAPSLQMVNVLVRAADAQTGLERVRAAAIKAGWWNESLHAPKIQIWTGDLSRPRLGLASSHWEHLQGTIDTNNNAQITGVIHVGALVHWHYNYSDLREANVLSTAQLLSIVAQNQSITRFEYVSGGAQWEPSDPAVLSISTLRRKLLETNGYGQSKLIAEQMVTTTSENMEKNTMERQGTRIGVMNPALIIGGPSHNHAANLDDLLWRVVSASVLVGEYHPEPQEWIYMSRAEDVAKLAVDAMTSPAEVQHQRRMLNGLRVETFWNAINEGLDEPLHPSSDYSAWLEKVNGSISTVGDAHPCWPVINMIESMGPEILSSPTPAMLADYNWEATERIVAEAVTENVRYLKKLGFFAVGSTAKDFATAFKRRG